MDVSASSNNSFSRPVTASKSSSDRQESEANQTAIFENKTQEKALQQRAVQEKLQQQNAESQRRLDGRLISFGYEEGNVSSQQQSSFNRSRVNDAYSPPPSHESSAQHQEQHSQDEVADAIDIVV